MMWLEVLFLINSERIGRGHSLQVTLITIEVAAALLLERQERLSKIPLVVLVVQTGRVAHSAFVVSLRGLNALLLSQCALPFPSQ